MATAETRVTGLLAIAERLLERSHDEIGDLLRPTGDTGTQRVAQKRRGGVQTRVRCLTH